MLQKKGLEEWDCSRNQLADILTFLYKTDIKGFKQKIKLPTVGFELITTTITGLEF